MGYKGLEESWKELKLSPRIEVYSKTIRDRLCMTKKIEEMFDVDDLIGSGIQITDREVIGYILAGLPSKFGPLMTIIDA